MNSEALLVKVFKFIIHPEVGEDSSVKWYLKVFNVLKIWGFYIGFALLFSMISNVLLTLFNYSTEDHAVSSFIEDESAWLVFFFGVIWAPITEELSFRFGLKFSPFRIALSLVFLTLFVILLFDIPLFPDNLLNLGEFSSIFAYGFFVIITTPVLWLVLKIKVLKESLAAFHTRIFPFLFYVSSLSFGFAHIANYMEGIEKVWFLAPLLIAPQLIFGFVLGFIRVKYGFIWAILSHALNNFLTLLPALLIFTLSSDLLKMIEEGDPNWIYSAGFSDYIAMLFAIFIFLTILLISLIATLLVLIELFSKKKVTVNLSNQ